MKQAKISVQYLARIDNPDGVVSPGLVIRQEQATPSGPTMVFRYVFGQMSASATVSGSPTSIGDSLPPLDTGPSDTQVIGDTTPADTSAPSTTDSSLTTGPDTGSYDSSGSSTGSYDSGSGVATTTDPAPAVTTPDAAAPTVEPRAGGRTDLRHADDAGRHVQHLPDPGGWGHRRTARGHRPPSDGGEAQVDVMKYLRNEWDRAGAWLCVIAGAIALIVGYFGVSGTLETGKQLPYVVSGGLAGLFLLGLGALLWVSADLRDEWRKLDAIDRHLVDGGGIPKPAPHGCRPVGDRRRRGAAGSLAPMTATQAVQAPASPWSAKQRLMLAVLLAIGVAGLHRRLRRDLGDAAGVAPGRVGERGRGGPARLRGRRGAVPDRRPARRSAAGG